METFRNVKDQTKWKERSSVRVRNDDDDDDED
jgi:hypothetical protein